MILLHFLLPLFSISLKLSRSWYLHVKYILYTIRGGQAVTNLFPFKLDFEVQIKSNGTTLFSFLNR
jgi:hypothetical protein